MLLSPRGHGHDFGDYIVYNALLMHFNVQIIILSVRRRAIIKIQISQFFVSLKHFKFPDTPTPPPSRFAQVPLIPSPPFTPLSVSHSTLVPPPPQKKFKFINEVWLIWITLIWCLSRTNKILQRSNLLNSRKLFKPWKVWMEFKLVSYIIHFIPCTQSVNDMHVTSLFNIIEYTLYQQL